MRGPLRLLPAAICAAALAAGCGGGSADENAYVQSVNGIQAQMNSSFLRLQERITPSSTPQQDQATLGGFLRAAGTAVRRLEAVDPPEDVAALHRRLIAQVSRYGTEIDRARAAVRSRDRRRLLEAQTDLSSKGTEIGRDVQAVINDINEELRG